MAQQQQQEPQLGQETVPFSLLTRRAAEEAFASLKEICEAAPEQSDSEKKISLLKFILKTRQRLLRLYVICKWCRQIPLVERCQQLVGTLSNHDMSFTQAANSLFYIHDNVQQSRAPMYDVPSAVDVLLTGGFHRLPKHIEDLDRQQALEGEKKAAAIEKLDTLLRSRLLDVQVPREFTSVTVRDGRLVLRVEGEFEVELTLGYRGIASLWRVLHLELLVGEQSSGPVKLTDRQRLVLGDDLERRMAALENPFGIIHSVLHELCASLVTDSLCGQVKMLQVGRWRDALRLDISLDGQQQQQDAEAVDGFKAQLKITYWLDPIKAAGGSSPSLKIEHGSEQQITCQHQPPVLDPLTGNEAEFALDQSCIDAEKLILKAINCSIHSRLVEVKKSLQSNANLCRAEGDVLLKAYGSQNSMEQDDVGNDCLYLRAYADVYICLGINIRNGRFIFRSPTFLPGSVLQEMEEALNQGTTPAVEVFANLRSKSIIHHFASLGSSLNLKAYEPGAISFKFPDESFKSGSNALVLGFPNTGDVYFLMMQLDQAFMPVFVLLEGEKPASSSRATSRQVVVLNRMTIDTEKCFLAGDDANLSLLGGKPRSTREPKMIDSKPGLVSQPAAPRVAKVEQTGYWQRSPLHGSPSASSLSSPPPPRTGLASQSGMFHSRRSSSANNLLSLNAPSPARSSVNRASPSSNMDFGRSRSPLHHDTPVSPDLDDEHLSKLIESISSENLAPASSRHLHPGARMARPASKSLNPRTPSHRMGLYDSSKEGDMRSPSHHLSSPPRQRPVKRKPDSDILSSLPSLQKLSSNARKRLKTEEQQPGALESFLGQSFSAIASAASQGKAPLASHMTVLLHVVKICWLAIKHARLTNQLRSLGISFYEEGGQASSRSLVFRLPASDISGDMRPYCNEWQRLHLSMGKPGSDGWDVKLQDPHYRELWNLQKQKPGEWGSAVQFAALSEADAHIKCSQEGLVLGYSLVEDDSIRKLLRDLDRLRSARAFSLCMKSLLEAKGGGGRSDPKWEGITRAFKVEAVGLTSLWFSYTGSMPGMLARFVVEWGAGHQGCIVHVSPEQLWPHTKYLEDYINGGDVELLLDAIRITAGPLHSLAGAIRPARTTTPVPASTPAPATTSSGRPITPTQASSPSVSAAGGTTPSRGALTLSPAQNVQAQAQSNPISAQGRGPGPGIVPSSLLPTDISVLMRSPYWIRIVYRKQFSVDMRCFEGDQVWLQPAPPPNGAGPEAGGSLPCPQFRPFVMENVAMGLNNPESGAQQNGQALALASGMGQVSVRPSPGAPAGGARPSASPTAPTSNGNNASSAAAQAITGLSIVPGRSLVIGGPAGVYPGYRGELNSAFCAMSDDGGYGGAWVPLAALKKVLRSTLKYLGVLWLFAQFPGIIREVLGSIMNGKDGTLLHLDAEQPALRFNIGNCMFAVNMHRHSLYLQGVDVRKFQNQPQAQAQAQGSGADADLTPAEMTEIADFFARRVTSEPYDASRLASFVTILTLPVGVLREFLVLISWKKEALKNQSLEPTPKPRIELCMENRPVVNPNEAGGGASSSSARSSIVHDRERGNVEFALNVLLDNACVSQVNVNVAGGAGWLPQCVSVKLRYQYNEGGRLVMRGMEGSHGGKACWSRVEEWERLKERTMAAVEVAAGQEQNGRLRAVAEAVQSSFQAALQQLRAG